MSEFKTPPISTLAGSSIVNFTRALSHGKIHKKYFSKILLSGLVSAISSPFQLYEKLRDIGKTNTDINPVFILGHWRSGTTFLHNLLCQAPDHGYVTTYQSVFPNNLHSKWLFKTFMKMNMPTKRPSDNVELNANFPQEDEFALGNMLAPSFYYFFYFPNELEQFFDQTVLFNSSNQWENEWEKSYRLLLHKAGKNTGANRVIVKNPVNTARVPKLMELYPNAQFVHIHRNPILVYLSTKKFFESLFPSVQLQITHEEQIQQTVLSLFKKVMNQYIATKDQIPKENFKDISFSEFEKNPLHTVEHMYHTFGWKGWEQDSIEFRRYLDSQSEYKKNQYLISQRELEQVQKEWKFAFDEFGYDIPQSVMIKD